MNIALVSQGLIFIPIILSVLVYILNNKKFNHVVFVGQLAITVLVILLWSHVLDHGVVSILLGGYERTIGIELRIDNLSMLFITMSIIIWWVVLIYSWDQKKKDYKFLFFLLFLEGSFLAILQTNDFFTMFVLVEIITIISAILILYKKDGISVKAGLFYLLFNSFGMMIYLFGLALLYLKTGTLNMSLIREFVSTSDSLSLTYSVIKISYGCFFVSMCVKAAIFPVYEWLPRAHTAAPAHISALLSGLLVKTGVFGLIRVLWVFEYDHISSYLFFLGFFTAISGILFAISQKDIKGILSFHTISQIGLITMSLANFTDIGLIGAYTHIFNHFLFKSILFLGAGIIINEYGVRRVTEIHGIGKSHPILTMCMGVGILSITGAPMFIGVLSKGIMKYSASSDLQTILFNIVSIGTLVSFIKFSKIFFGEPFKYKKINKKQISAILVLVSLCFITFIVQLNVIPEFVSINNEGVSEKLAIVIKSVSEKSITANYYFEYILMALAAFIIYWLFVKTESKILKVFRHFRMKFQDAIIFLILFLVLTIQVIN